MTKEVIIDLNGKKITAPTNPNSTTFAFQVKNDRLLIINGDGVVDGGSGSYNNNVISIEGGHVIINGGLFKTGRDKDGNACSCIYIRKPGGTLEINGGEFMCPKSLVQKDGKDWYPVLNVINSLKRSKYKIQITGGSFLGYNPADGDETGRSSFIADGYESVIDGEFIDNEGNIMPIYKIVKK